MEEAKLGKIENILFGYGGYQNAMFGLSITLSGKGWGVGDFKGGWSLDITVGEYTKWTEEDRDKEFAKVCRFTNKLLQDAKKQTIDQLKNIPVEVTFDGNSLKSWRILTEVI